MGVVAVAAARPASLARRLECFPYQYSKCPAGVSVPGLVCAEGLARVHEVLAEVVR